MLGSDSQSTFNCPEGSSVISALVQNEAAQSVHFFRREKHDQCSCFRRKEHDQCSRSEESGMISAADLKETARALHSSQGSTMISTIILQQSVCSVQALTNMSEVHSMKKSQRICHERGIRRRENRAEKAWDDRTRRT